ncbi:hypothetical protein Lal_00021385 [Lupinus albus]|nr:hypothetical protein Lal_00021385 [Lupinus albus]
MEEVSNQVVLEIASTSQITTFVSCLCFDEDKADLKSLKTRHINIQHDQDSDFGKVMGLTPEMLLNCFLSGLNLEIAIELAIQQPFFVTHAIGLAKLVESKIAKSKLTTWHYPRRNRAVPITPTMESTFTDVHTISSTTFPIKHLTTVQMEEHRAQRLCYNYDEKYINPNIIGCYGYTLIVVTRGDRDPHLFLGVIIEEARRHDGIRMAYPRHDANKLLCGEFVKENQTLCKGNRIIAKVEILAYVS